MCAVNGNGTWAAVTRLEHHPKKCGGLIYCYPRPSGLIDHLEGTRSVQIVIKS